MPSLFEEASRVYDFLKWMVEERYCLVSGTIANQTGVLLAQGSIVPGTPLNLNGTQWETINAGSEAGIDGFFVDPRTFEEVAIAGTSVKQYAILARGPALINKDAIPANDLTVTPDAYSLSAIVTRAAALDIQVLAEPVSQETQLT